MIAAGFRRFTMGCESGADSLLRRMGRRSHAAQIMASVKQITEAGGLVATSWICNLPGGTAADFQAPKGCWTAWWTPGGLSTGSKTCMFCRAAPCTTTPGSGI